MNILIAPNSFRGSLDALQIANIIENAFNEVSSNFEITKIPVADGGDFTGEVLLHSLGGSWKTVQVLDPLGRTIDAALGITNNGVGIVELSKASGLKLLATDELDLLKTTTYGTGQLIKAALDEGCRKIIVTLSDVATIDGGVGLLQALGVRFLDTKKQEIGFGGGELDRIETIEESGLDERIKQTSIIVPCDIHNYVLGEKGVANTFAPQRRATAATVELLEECMTNYSLKVWEDFRRDIVNLKYGGAGGGTAAGLWAFLNARLLLGSRYILSELNFDKAVEKADLIITTEGRLDNQTINGKAPFEVATRAKRFNKTIIALAGQVPSSDVELFHAVFSIINKPMSLHQAIENTEKLLYTTSLQIAKLYHQFNKPKPKPKTIDTLLVLNFDMFGLDNASLEQLAFTLSPLKSKEIPLLLYSERTYEEMLWLCEQLAIYQPFITESGSALYVPQKYLKLELEGFTNKGEYNELIFGTTTATIENITEKLAKVTGLSTLKNDIVTPLDLADYWDIDMDEAERIMARTFSQMIVKTEDTQPLNDIFKMLVEQQGLGIIETDKTYILGYFSYEKAIDFWIAFLKSKFENLQIIAVSDTANDTAIFEICSETFLLKKDNAWQPIYVDDFNLINGSGIAGLKQVIDNLQKKVVY